MTQIRNGIIDIGSNSIRLVIYEQTATGANRVIDGTKRPARLSEKIDRDGRLPEATIQQLIGTLNHFKLICSHQRVSSIRAVATAAIRNSTNREEVLTLLREKTGLPIEILSGEQEAEYGFLGMLSTLDVRDGLLVDIGGGSTEITLFRDRVRLHSVSFPFGCVNLNRRFMENGMMNDKALAELQSHVAELVRGERWIAEAAGLPVVGIGGTARAFGKIHQASTDYPFTQTHNYPIAAAEGEGLLTTLRQLPLDKRKKFPGLSKDRVDLIVPGLAALQTILAISGCSGYLICGAGLRDGLFLHSGLSSQDMVKDVLAYSIDNLGALHPEAPAVHVRQVHKMAMELFENGSRAYAFPARARRWMEAASRLFRIGASIDYYKYAQHSFYLIMNSHLNGLSHREIVLTAAIASYKNKGKAKQAIQPYQNILEADDLEHICRLGTLLQLAVALDRSEAQTIGRLQIDLTPPLLTLRPLEASTSLEVERREIDALADDFKKIWQLTPVLQR
ncbi:Ppx/GppA family phosphatase [Paenibacillus sp. 1P07SE]|uniref:Ppx/GppA phosphatase family protein n=1 Tax=Paenibacillus sp. 1P07SE TaxID=3132209 RepID=UPI0039A5BAFA